MALVWRGYTGTFALADIVIKGLIVPYVIVLVFSNPAVSSNTASFLAHQQKFYDSFLQNLEAYPLVLAHLKSSWHLDKEIVSIRAQTLAFYMFSGLLLYKEGSWYQFIVRFVLLLFSVALISAGLELLLVYETLSFFLLSMKEDLNF
jgi:hypothetical protein